MLLKNLELSAKEYLLNLIVKLLEMKNRKAAQYELKSHNLHEIIYSIFAHYVRTEPFSQILETL